MTVGSRRVGPPHSEAWYAARRGVVTASQSYHLVMDPSEVRWHLSPPELAEDILGARRFANEAMDAGSFFEVPNMGWFGSRVGRAVEPDGCLLLDDRLPSMGASADGWLRGPTESGPPRGYEPALMFRDGWGTRRYGRDAAEAVRALPEGLPVEMKHVASKNRSKWTKRPPEYYVWQVRHQLAVADAPAGLLVARVDAHELYAHLIERDAALEARLVEACERFRAEYLAPCQWCAAVHPGGPERCAGHSEHDSC